MHGDDLVSSGPWPSLPTAPVGLLPTPQAPQWGAAPGLTSIEDSFQRLDVRGHPRYPVDAHLLNAPLLHLLHALPHDVGYLGALPPGEKGWASEGG